MILNQQINGTMCYVQNIGKETSYAGSLPAPKKEGQCQSKLCQNKLI